MIVSGAESNRRHRSCAFRSSARSTTPCLVEEFAVRLRDAVGVRELHVLVARVVKPADEHRLGRNLDAARGEDRPHPRVVENLRDGPAVGAADRPAARPAVVRRLVRVVHAVRPVAEQDHQPREAADQPRVLQHALADARHLLDREPDAAALRAGRGVRALQAEPRLLRRLDELPRAAAQSRCQPREQHAGDQRDRRERAQPRGEHRAG